MNAFRIAIVGSGPAGLYVADELVRQSVLPAEVDVLDRLPAPYGLVRYGVAPDHPRIKSIIASLQRILEHDRVRFLGDIDLGTDIDRADLEAHYDAVVYATGAALDRRTGVPGEELPGSLSATEFVSWYSGHPDRAPEFDLSARSAAVVGAGNVALDVARVLAKTEAELTGTDMPPHVLGRLGRSAVRDIHVICRRGPQHAKFTTRELRELRDLADAGVVVDAGVPHAVPPGEYDRPTRANLAVLRQFADEPRTDVSRRIHFHFWTRPSRIEGGSRVEGLRVERTRDAGDGTVEGTGAFETLPVQLVVRSVGYRSVPVARLPFDEARGVVPNAAGRVTDAEGTVMPGHYVAGWLKRGPSGVIGTNRADSAETVAAVVADLARTGRRTAGTAASFDALLRAREIRAVTWRGWLAIDGDEIARGRAAGKERTKIADWETLRRLGGAVPAGSLEGGDR
jgi:ferredoxin--NADP+ reductase